MRWSISLQTCSCISIFIQQSCTIAKNLQPPGRQALFSNYVSAGLFHVITYALKHPDPVIRVAGTEILIGLIDHDNLWLRGQIFKAINEKQKPLTDTLIELLLQEPDLGVKAQMADAIKVLLDPVINTQSIDHMSRTNPDLMAKIRHPSMMINGVSEFVQSFYNESARKLFKPLRDLATRSSSKFYDKPQGVEANFLSVEELSISEAALYSHLTETLCFFLRQHAFRTKNFLQINELNARVAQLFRCPEKFLQLTALKYFRTCLAMTDPWHQQQLVQCGALEPVLDILLATMPKDNLLNSACLDFFEFIRRVSRPYE